MSTFDFEMGTEISTDLNKRPQSIMDKEKELSELLDHVMQAPLAPLHHILGNLEESFDTSKVRLDSILRFIQSNGEDLESIKRRVNAIEAIWLRLDELEIGLSLAFAETAKASELTEVANAALRRDQTAIDALTKAYEEVQKSTFDAAKRGRRLFMLTSLALSAIFCDILLKILIYRYG